MLTEEEAKAKWCPFARYATDTNDNNSANRWSKNDVEDDSVYDNPKQCRCIASACMAFRWVPDITMPLKDCDAILDAEDSWATAKSWWFDGRYVKGDGGEKYLHREIVARALGGPVPDGMLVDHIDGNPLNMRRGNLRVCTSEQNAANAASRGGKSQYRGVHQSRNGKWVAQISKRGVRVCLGTFETELEAAGAYDTAAKEIHGEFARLNLIVIENSGRRGYCGLAGAP